MRYALIIALVLFACAALLGQERGATPSAQDAWKAAHAHRCAAELAARDVSHLSDAQQAARLAMIDELIRYGDRGRFAQNEDYPGEAIPHLIDAAGTRCALANLIDVSGEGALIERLAAHNNIAFVPELKGDAALNDWLDRHGLSIEEAAYIQGPGWIDPRLLPREETPPGIPPPPGDRFVRGNPDSREPDAPDPVDLPSAPPATSGAAPTLGENGRPTRRGGAPSLDWQTWWSLNRRAFLDLRSRYHAGVVLTGPAATERGRRPSEHELDATVLPLLERLATGDDRRVRTTALMAWARAARTKHAPKVIAAVKQFIADKDNAWRDVMVLALGIVQHPDALPTLEALAHDTIEGRRAMRKRGPVGERVRALAVIALGQSGQQAAVDPILGVLTDEDAGTDLQACAVLALGAIARDVDGATRRRVGAYLVKELRAGKRPDAVLAQVPTALARTGDAALLMPAVTPTLERFRKPTLVRQSSALAIATLAPTPDADLLDTLIATARRDPDDAARRFGILALGELATGESLAPEHTKKLKRYYVGAFAGRNIQKTDLPWLCFSAALFGRGQAAERTWVRSHLEGIATSSASKERAAAAIAALGLLGDVRALPMLRTRLAEAKDKLVRGYTAEALGVLGDRSQREALLALVRTDGDDSVRYRAALGLGYSADQGTLDAFLDVLASTPSQDAQAVLSRVVGELGDRRALPRLVKLAGDPATDTWTRRRALAAIGMIAQASDVAWVTTYQRGVNYPIATPTLRILQVLY